MNRFRRPGASTPPPPQGPREVTPPIRSHLAREVWVGIFVLSGIITVISALLLFTQPALFRGRYTIATIVPDAGGIRHGDPVEIRGVVVGRIAGFDIEQKGVRVRLEIEKRYRVPADSTVRIGPEGLLGGSAARIESGRSPEPAHPGAVLPGTAQGSPVDQVSRIASESEQIAARLQSLLSEETVRNIKSSTSELEQLLGQLSSITSEQRTHIDRILRSFENTAGHMERLTSSPDIQQSLQQVNKTTQELQTTSESLRRTSESLDVILGRVRQGRGTLGMLSADESLYVNANGAMLNLGASAAELRRLAEDIRLHPSRYIHVSVF